MKLSQVQEFLEEQQRLHGDIPLVLWDLDSSGYYTLTPSNFELQEMGDKSKRMSVGVNYYDDPRESEPAYRPVEKP